MMMRFLMLIVLVFGVVHAKSSEAPKIPEGEILYVSTTMGKARQERKAVLLKEVFAPYNLRVNLVFDKDLDAKNAPEYFKNHQLILLDSLSGKMGVGAMLRKHKANLEASAKIVKPFKLKGSDKGLKGMSEEDAAELEAYYINGGRENFERLAAFSAKRFFNKEATVKPPLEIAETGIYHPKKEGVVFKTLENYLASLTPQERALPKIGIAMHRENIVSDDTQMIDDAMNQLISAGYLPIAFFTKVGEEDFVGERFFTHENKVLIDAIISFQVMIIDHEALKETYARVGVPVLHGHVYREGDQAKWEEDEHGVPMSWIPMAYVIPETIGYTDPLIVAAVDDVSKTNKPIPYQLKSLVNKAINLSKLKQTANQEKKVAILFYNYPSGVNNFGASYMEAPGSLEAILAALKERGYNADAKEAQYFIDHVKKVTTPYYKGIKEVPLSEFNELMPFEVYERWFNALPERVKQSINKAWGAPEDNPLVMTKEGKRYFLIPRMKLGNIYVMPQPSRGNPGSDKDESMLYHDVKSPVSHHYLAVYLYLREYVGVHALVHLGTHGTQEWTMGKERGLSVYDSPYLAVGDTPVVYPYITNNLAEGIQAKRRGRATLISHQTPPFAISGTYKELSDLMELMNDFSSSMDAVKESTWKKLKITVIETNLHKDMEITPEAMEADREGFVSKLYDHITGLSKTLQPLGMHVFGSYPKKSYMVHTLIAMLGDGYINLVQGEKGFGETPYEEINASDAYKYIERFVIENASLDDADGSIRPYMQTARTYYENFKAVKEMPNFLKALEGGFIETSVGGDPVRSPDCLPTGRNMYGFDPDRVPTKGAYATGEKLMKDYIENYYAQNGKYPDKITFNLWSLETMRHFGVLESQIYYAMGARPIWSEGGISDKMVQGMAAGMLGSFLPEGMAKFLAQLVTVQRIGYFTWLMPEKMRKDRGS